jgi:hypothetical protein
VVTPAARIASVIVGIATAAGAYVWWNSPERQIRRVLANVADVMSHDAPVRGLAAAAAAAGLQDSLAADVVIEAGRPFGALRGRDAVVSAAARIFIVTPSMRLEFVDTKVAVAADGRSATIDCSAVATITDRAGQESVDAREVMMTMNRVNGTWVISSAKALDVLEPVS